MNSSLPHLSTLILWPLLCALTLAIPRNPKTARTLALVGALVELSLTAALLLRFDFTSDRQQFVERYPWIESLNIDYAVGIDGLSVFFPSCTAVLVVAVMLASWTNVHALPKLYLGLVLLLESATMGVFAALDLGAFFFFWELALIPLYFLISLWGAGPHRRFAAAQYALLMMFGGVCLLFGIVLLAVNHAQVNGLPLPAGLSFDYGTLLATHAPSALQTQVFLLLAVGFGVKAPLFPFHGWLPTIALEAPAATVALITGLKLGLYGLLRFAIPLAPEAAAAHFWVLAVPAAIGLIHGALLALRQSNFRRMLAYASISHAGLVTIGLASMNLQGLQGAVFQLINFSVVSSGLFLLSGFLHQRVGSTERVRLGGISRRYPLLTSFVFLLGIASIGMPGTGGFPAELLLIIGAFESHSGLGAAALLGFILGAVYFFRFFRDGFLGSRRCTQRIPGDDLLPRELLVAGALTAFAVVPGWFPQAILAAMEPAALAWVQRASGGLPDHPSAFAAARFLPAPESASPAAHTGTLLLNRASHPAPLLERPGNQIVEASSPFRTINRITLPRNPEP